VRALPWLVAFVLLAGCLGGAEQRQREEEPAPPPAPTIGGVDVAALNWSEVSQGPTPRTEVVVGTLAGKIYVIGGFPLPDGLPPVPLTVPLTLVEVFEPASGAWSRGPEYPLQVHHGAAVELDGTLYVLGGLVTAGFQPTPLSFKLTPGASAWTPIARMPAPRGSHAAAAIDGAIYLAGGTTSGGHVAEVWRYDPASDLWMQMDHRIPTPRDHTAGGAVQGKFCVAAGDVRGHGVNTNATECYDPASGNWTVHAPVPVLRGSVAAAVWHDRLVVLGGQNATRTFADVEAFDLANDTWLTLPPLNLARHGFGAAVVDGNLYALYGGPRPGLTVTSSVEKLVID